MTQPDGTSSWPNDLSPVDRVALALADVVRARAHVTAAFTAAIATIHAERMRVDGSIDELKRAVDRLVVAARGDHK